MSASEIVVLGRGRSVFYTAKFKKVKNTGDLTYSLINCALEINAFAPSVLIFIPNFWTINGYFCIPLYLHPYLNRYWTLLDLFCTLAYTLT